PLVLFGGVYLLIFRPPQIFKAKWRILRQLIIVFGGAALLSLPFYLPLIADALDPAQAYYLKTQSAGWIIFSTDPLSFLSLSPFTPWTRPFALPFSYSVLNANITEGAAYLGVIAVLLVTVAVLRKREYVGLWVTLLLGTMLFSLGPMLKWQEQIVTYTLGLDSSHIVLPWALFQKLPLVDLIRTPGRFNLLTALPLGILAAIGLNELLSGLRRPAMRIAVSGLLIVGITAEYQLRFPFPTFSTSQPAYLQNLALRTDVHAVFDVPYLETHKQALLEQMAHHKAIIAGYYSRSTPVNPAKLMLLSEVARGLGWHADTPGAGFPGPSLEPDDVRSILKDNGIDVIIYHWALLDKQSTRAWALGVFGPPAYEDDQIGAFEVPAPAMHSTRLALTHVGQYWWPFSAPNDGWWPDQPDDQRKVGQDYSTDPLWLKAGARIAAYTPVATLQHFTLTLTPLYGAHSLSLSVDDHLFQVWTVNRPGMAADFWLAFQPGFHALQFSVTDGCIPLPVPPQCMENAQTSSMDSKCAASSATSYCLSMQVNHLQTADSGLPYHPVAIHLGRGMTLQGFRLPAEVTRGSHLLVETDWLAAQRLPGDYHLFIHVFSQDSKLLAQYDTIPNGGRFPTTEWAGSQPWSATASLPVPADAAPGTYEVYAGWYQYPDMTRLSVSGDGKHAADGLVYLASFTVR
ncbi:MAG TPA: hypothetical protein VMT24_15960, partial [Aggregatilineaceae bacterium]|nr:hypothetical protein [Aggregatilineaceae bacterium]